MLSLAPEAKYIMKWTRCFLVIMANVFLLGIGSGCSGEPPRLPDPDERASAKVDAIKRLADAMAQDPSGAEARGALEDFRNIPLDVQKNPKQAAEIVDLYRQRIQGKYRGFVAQEIQAEMAPLLARLKPSK